MKTHRMPFVHWDDDHTKLIRMTKEPEFVDPVYYVKAHFHRDSEGNGPYFLNKRCRALLDKHGPFKDRYRSGLELVDRHKGRVCFIFCPGPSMVKPPRGFCGTHQDRVTMAVNSAAFAVDAEYWVMAESCYALWLTRPTNKQKIPSRKVLSTARVAVVLRDRELQNPKTVMHESVHVLRWEEEFIVPPRVPAVSVFNALVTAWQMGCREVRLIGLDLSRPAGKAYTKGVPHTQEGASNPFDDQIRALRQIFPLGLPGMKVINGSPYSRHLLPFCPMDYKEIFDCPTIKNCTSNA